MTHTVLLIEDNPDIRKINRSVLTKQGFRVLEAETLEKGRELLFTQKPSLLVLDIMMPDGSGLDFCSKLREKTNVPILFLSAMGENQNVVDGFRCGGDDYLAKPYDLNVFCARVNALVRRIGRINEQSSILALGLLELNTVSDRAYCDGEDLMLSHMEYTVLEYLVHNRNRFVTTQELYEKLWDMDDLGDRRTVWSHVSRLRKKLEKYRDVIIISERKHGYRVMEKSPDNDI